MFAKQSQYSYFYASRKGAELTPVYIAHLKFEAVRQKSSSDYLGAAGETW